MHGTALALLVVAVALTGLAPLLVWVAWLLRRARAGSATSSPRGAGGLRPLWVALAGAAVLFLGTGGYLLAGGPGGSEESPPAPEPSPSEIALPTTFAGLPLVDGRTGREAVDETARLHGLSFPLVSAAIGRYEGSGGTAEVWIAAAAGPAAARDLARRMADRMGEGRGPFDPPRLRSPGVWETRGLGQAHYFLATGSEVWWISADPGIVRRALADLEEMTRG